MASIIKKQILKHLSKFTKNLSADKINVSTLRGEGELSNLELDCVALQNLMNLPTWLEFKCANCNKVSVKIPWTKLKTTPICIFLDNVEVEMVTCEKPREPNGPSPIQASASSGDTSYGFTEKVLEGMTVNINSISINFSSAAFHATFQLSQLLVISTNPKWEQSDLRSARITDKTLGQVLTFKKISWQTMRIVADAITASDKTNITPVRLITNQSEIKMVFRRRTSDCAILASQLLMHFDDLLWVLTDSQVQSALLCVKSLRDTIERSSQQMRDLGLVKPHDAQVPAKPPPTTTLDTEDQSSSTLFSRHTVVETSIHLDFDRVDLHICEEGTPVHKGRKRGNLEGGAIQIALHNLKVDHYPYHKAASDREHFRDFSDTMKERNSWADGIIKRFRKDFVELKKAAEAAGNLHINPNNKRPSKLSENCLSVRLTDIDIHKVTTSSSQKQESGRLLNSTRKELLLPDEMPLFHLIRTEYYYPDGRDYPAPHNNIFMQLNAPQLRAYWDSLVWLDALATTTVQAVQKMLEDLGIIQKEEEEEDSDVPEKEPEEEHVDIRIQVLMPKIFIPGPPSTDLLKPYGLEIQVSRAAITNCRDGTDCSRTHLSYILKKAEKQHFSRNPDAFPGEKGFDMPFMQDMLRQHADGDDLPLRITQRKGNAALTGNALKTTSAKDVWAIDLEQVWIDFVMPGCDKKNVKTFEYDGDLSSSGGFLGLDKPGDDPISNGHHLPFLDSFPVMLWISKTTLAEGVSKLAVAGLSRASSLSASVENFPPLVNLAKEDVGSQSKSQTDISFSKCNGQVERAHSPAFSSSTPDLRSKSIPRITSPTNSLDSGGSHPNSPRMSRNRRLLDYYRVGADEETSLKEEDVRSVSTTSSTTSRKNKATATHIVIHTDKSLRLQLDHHQYLFLLRLIDTVEEVGERLEQNSERILNSTPSSTASTPSHSISGDDTFNAIRIRKKRTKPIEVSSVRLSAPAADLFIVLRPPPNTATKESCLQTESLKKVSTPERTNADSARSSPVDSESIQSNGDKNDTSCLESRTTPPAHPQLVKTASLAHDTPPVSECSSENVSIVGSDTISIFGDLSGMGSAVYPHSDTVPGDSHSSSPVHHQFSEYPHEESDTDSAQLLPKEQAPPQDTIGDTISFSRLKEASYEEPSLMRQKSGSLSLLSNPVASAPDEPKAMKSPPHRNHSSGNLTLLKLSHETSSTNSLMVVKSGSSGYESGSHESLSPVKGKNLSQPPSSSSPHSSHSHSSSDASDQFVMIQVDENGKGMEESGTIRIVRKQKVMTSSPSIQSETSSIASNKSTSVHSEVASKSELEQDSMSSCGMADSQITVTNAKSTSSLESESSCDNRLDASKHANSAEELPSKEKPPVPDMSSLLHLHVSDGIGLSVDSNNLSDSIVKIAATTLHITELGVLKTDKIENTFIDNTPKKIEASLSTTGLKRSEQGHPQVCLRIDTGPLAQRFSEVAVKEGHIQVGAKNLPLCLNSSTLANLGAFLEDEILPKVVPMRIEAQDVQLTIKDDMPPAYDVTPPAPPITLNVRSASVLRSDDGTFHVTTSSEFDGLSKPQGLGTLGVVATPSVNSRDAMVDRSTDTSDLAVLEEGSSAEVPMSQRNGTISPDEKTPEVGHKPCAPDVNGVSNATSKPGLSNGTGGPQTDDPSVVEDLLEQIKALQMERDSLAGALRYMQEELISSERERSNLRAQVN